eukprot:6485531-Amphidinium_carterae.1
MRLHQQERKPQMMDASTQTDLVDAKRVVERGGRQTPLESAGDLRLEGGCNPGVKLSALCIA